MAPNSDATEGIYLATHVYGTDLEEMPLSCKECGKTFSAKSGFRMHTRVHTREKLYSCKECEKAFSASNNLSTHMRTHTEEKPYSCKRCGKTFSGSNNMSINMRTHAGEKPYSCNECGKAFSQHFLSRSCDFLLMLRRWLVSNYTWS